MSQRTVKHVMNPAKPPPLTARHRSELDALKVMPDAAIDTSDIPRLTDAFWKNAVRNPFHKPAKTPAAERLDSGEPP